MKFYLLHVCTIMRQDLCGDDKLLVKLVSNEKDQLELAGIVKWFDPSKGFGFVVQDGSKEDILLHANVLRNFGQSSVADGARVTFLATRTQRGHQVTEVVKIQPPVGDANPLAEFEEFDPAVVANLPRLACRVKWFDKAKGFGFANAFGSHDDIFIHVEILRKSGLADLLPGEAISLRVIQGKRGKLAAEVSSWESASF